MDARGLRWRSPWAGGGHGPLPQILIVLTAVTGVVDAVSYIALGHVFVANMTGNIVFLGFALGGAPGLSAGASLTALGAFLIGATIGGRAGASQAAHRGHQLRAATSLALVPVAVALVAAALFAKPVSGAARYAMIVPLGLAMGIQNATARRLAVPDLTTTVLTLTLTGIAADSGLAGGGGGHTARRLLPVVAMLAGALVGALLVLEVDLVLPLLLAALLLAASAFFVHRHSAGHPDWA